MRARSVALANHSYQLRPDEFQSTAVGMSFLGKESRYFGVVLEVWIHLVRQLELDHFLD